ncbi:MAG: Txe/YoeB family addiction module toxin [Firmicutes bacterium]|nr:Txe/YoeB family addiction module toxin [Bacillota bacterium]
MVEYKIVYTKEAAGDVKKLKASKLDQKAKALIEVIRKNPYQNPPPYEKLLGDLSGLYSRRINIKHRLVYQVFDDEKVVKITSMWSHYE